MSTFVVIMAGGTGSRFWPMSRRAQPKQLLALAPGDDRTLLRASVERILPLAPIENVFIVTGAHLVAPIAEELPDLPRENIMAEPCGRNTAPCVGWAAAKIARRDPDATMIVLPADHLIADEPAFLNVLRNGVEAAAGGALVTCGIEPTRPETGYGYLHVGDEVATGVRRVARFVEKPNLEKAKEFLADGGFLWNSGMFFFRVGAIRNAIRAHLPELETGLARFDDAAANGNEDAVVEAGYGDLPSISIDHGIMEKAEDVLVVPGSFGWSDLGSWMTSWELGEKDDAENTTEGDVILVDAMRSLVVGGKGRVVALVGVDDLVVVDTPDALLVARRDKVQQVRAVVSALEKRGDERR